MSTFSKEWNDMIWLWINWNIHTKWRNLYNIFSDSIISLVFITITFASTSDDIKFQLKFKNSIWTSEIFSWKLKIFGWNSLNFRNYTWKCCSLLKYRFPPQIIPHSCDLIIITFYIHYSLITFKVKIRWTLKIYWVDIKFHLTDFNKNFSHY